MNLRSIPTLPAIGGLTVLYFVAGKLALKLAFLNASASPVWPSAGIALAALLLLGYRAWPAVFLGAFLVNFATAGTIGTSLGIAVGNTLEAVCGAWLVNRFAGGASVFEGAGRVFKFALAVALSTILSPCFGLTSLALGGFASWSDYNQIWLTWWLGDVTGDLVITPLVVLWCQGTTRRWTRGEIVEVSLLFLALLAVAEITFGGWFPINAKNYPIAFLYAPILVWLTFRFTPRETATGIFILTSIAIWGTLHGLGPFVLETEHQSLLILQARTALLAITAMALAAAMAERRQAEAMIEKQKEAVEAANRTKDNFLAMLSHELRTPLTPVVAALETLQTGSLDASEAKAALAMIQRNIDLEIHLIDDLLDLTRITKGKLQLQLKSLDAHAAISNVVEMCATEIAAKNLHLSLDLRAAEHHIAADPPKFQQIVWNLLKNAIKFTAEEGRIAIATSNPSPQSLTVAVTDNGIGIEPETMRRMFDRFEQGGHSFERRFGGLGLGLTISKSLAEAHGGTLRAESEGRGRGARFFFTVRTALAEEGGGESPAAESKTRPRALRILLVDDHRDTAVALEKLLQRRGHTVATAHDMQSALEVAGRDEFDLLISDVGLPDGSGLELLNRLRATAEIPGIAISGFGMSVDIEKSLRAGFHEHLVKPVHLEKLEAAIEHATSVAGKTGVRSSGPRRGG